MKVNKENQTADVMGKVELLWIGFCTELLRTPKHSNIFDLCILPIPADEYQTWVLARPNMDKISSDGIKQVTTQGKKATNGTI